LGLVWRGLLVADQQPGAGDVATPPSKRWGGDLYVAVMTVINSVREVITLPISG
jgi:hypothetical protein